MSYDPDWTPKHEKAKQSKHEFKTALADFISNAFHIFAESKTDPDNNSK